MAGRAPAEATQGPDWIDVGVYVRAIQDQGKGIVSLSLGWGADKYSGPCQVLIRHEYPRFVGAGKLAKDEVFCEWPNKLDKTLSACVYRQLYELDKLAAKNGVQLIMDL